MNEAVFISDLHLHPDDPLILARFEHWVTWALVNTRRVYILGDFFHAWAGDDTMDAWAETVADTLQAFALANIPVYFMHGNRDFLLGPQFMARAGMQCLPEPTLITLGEQRVLLAHGDGYCRQDKAHQWFRWLTRNRVFVTCFMWLPRRWRVALVQRVRARSQVRTGLSNQAFTGIQVDTLLEDVHRYSAQVIVHGHTHRPEMTSHVVNGDAFVHVVLSDWDAQPSILCYNKNMGLYFEQTTVSE